ncbi:MAG: SsrA-binding protein SmpB [Candidatus Paracaedibacteraceae bacterium]|nr:SsrA-binding protein SmpB [Candidatus Paracaedibacteraceae bacterium]
MSKDKEKDNYKVVAHNKRARFDYELIETLEAGIMLMGSEVKSLRLGKTSINEAYIGEMTEEGADHCALYLINATISEYPQAHSFGHTEKRPRRLLVRKRQMNKFLGAIRKKGMTIVPLKLYFNAKGLAKMDIALAKGKQTHDKRAAIKDRDWNREKARVMKGE